MPPDPFTPDRPYNTTLTDSAGARWHFAFWGSDNVYIREMHEGDPPVSFGGNASRDDWPFVIDLFDYGLRPPGVTAEWLDARAHGWITNRNTDIIA